MMKNIITLFLISVSFLGFSQKFSNSKTSNHIQVKGTNVFMIPPKSFNPTNSFKGFQDPNDLMSMIMVTEIQAPFKDISNSFNEESLKTKGMSLTSKKESKTGAYNKILLNVDQSVNGNNFSKHILILGNKKSSVMINGVHLKDSLKLGEQIKQSVLSTFIDAKATVNPRDGLSFDINENVGSLKFHSVTGNNAIFQKGTKTARVGLVIEKSYAKTSITDRKKFCELRLKKYPSSYSLIANKNITEVEIDGLQGFELYAKKDNKKKDIMYQVILFDNDQNYYLFVGMYHKDNTAGINDIKKVINTFKRKK